MINKAIEYLPAKLIGWDIAITNKGPCIIEGSRHLHGICRY